MRPELPTAVAVDNSASIQPVRSIFISWGKSVQISGATSEVKTLPRSGCGLITMAAQIGPRAGSHLSSGWPWLHNVSTSASLAKGGITV